MEKDKPEVKISYTCSWCGKHEAIRKPIKLGYLNFCSFACLDNYQDHYNDNLYSDVDNGL